MNQDNLDNLAELKFKNWLDKNKISYLYINQNPETFSSVFKDSLKRPDFMILLPHFGFIFVDVKDKKINKEFGTYCIDVEETKRFSSFQRKFNSQIWYVLSNEDFNYKTWLWIPVSKVLEFEKETRTSSKSNEDFFPIKSEEFIQVAEDDSISRIFIKNL